MRYYSSSLNVLFDKVNQPYSQHNLSAFIASVVTDFLLNSGHNEVLISVLCLKRPLLTVSSQILSGSITGCDGGAIVSLVVIRVIMGLAI